MNIYEKEIKVGDYVEVMTVNKKGDRNLDGAVLKGKVKDEFETHNMLRLESGWCCHRKDRLLKHITKEEIK